MENSLNQCQPENDEDEASVCSWFGSEDDECPHDLEYYDSGDVDVQGVDETTHVALGGGSVLGLEWM